MHEMILYGHEHSKYSSLFSEIYSLRYKVFVKGRGWSLPSRGGHEIDQYDTDDAVYFLTFGDNGSIEGSVRATPTDKSSLIADYYPELVERGEPARSPLLYETTRFIVQPAKHTRAAMRTAKSRLLVPLIEWCLDRRVSHFQTMIDTFALQSYVEISPQHTKILGLSHPYGGGRGVPGGGECMALQWPVSTDLLDDVIAYGGLPDKQPAISAATTATLH